MRNRPSQQTMRILPPYAATIMAWLFLGVAGVLEIAFAFGMKASMGFTRWVPSLVTVVTGVASVVLLAFSLRTLPVGTGYAVWTGIGAVGTVVLGILVLGEPAAPVRLACIALILAGIVGLKLSSGA